MRLFIFVTILLCAATARAEKPQPLGSLDETKPWQAVGRLNIGARGLCTGTLVAPDLVLTAAHCLFDHATGARVFPDQVQFLAGWRAGRAAAYRDARRIVMHPDYHFKGRENIDDAAYDLALVELANPIRTPAIAPFETGQHPKSAARLQVVSYGKARADALSIERACEVLLREGGLYVTSCSVEEGSSGAPVFAPEGGVDKVIAVVSAKAEWGGKPVALATGVEDSLSVLLDLLDRADGVFHRAESSVVFRKP